MGGDQAGRTPQPQGTAGGGWRWPSTRESGPFKSDPGACWGDAGATSRLGIGLWEEERAPPRVHVGAPRGQRPGAAGACGLGPSTAEALPRRRAGHSPRGPTWAPGCQQARGDHSGPALLPSVLPWPLALTQPGHHGLPGQGHLPGCGPPRMGRGASAGGRQVYPTWLLAVGLSPGRPPAPRCPPGAGAGTSGPRPSTGLPRPLSRPLLWTSGGGRA